MAELELYGQTWNCEEYFKVPLEKAIIYDKKLKKVYNSFRRRFQRENTDDMYIYLLKDSHWDIKFYKLLWVGESFSFSTRADLLDLDNWIKQANQISVNSDIIISLLDTNNRKIVLEIDKFNYRLAENIKTQAILEKI